jgi:hypothetical protein
MGSSGLAVSINYGIDLTNTVAAFAARSNSATRASMSSISIDLPE